MTYSEKMAIKIERALNQALYETQWNFAGSKGVKWSTLNNARRIDYIN